MEKLKAAQIPVNEEKLNNQIIINQDNKIIVSYQGFEVVIRDKNSQVTAQSLEQNESQEINSLTIPNIKQDIDYAFCKQNQQNNQSKTLKSQNNTTTTSHDFGFRFNSKAGKLINTVNEGVDDEAKNKAWEDLLTNHDTVIFKLASDGQNYIRFYLKRNDKSGKIEFAFDECLFSKEEALELSKNSTSPQKTRQPTAPLLISSTDTL